MKDEQQQPDVEALVRGHLDDEQRPRIGVSPSCSTSSMLADGDALVADKLPGSARNQSCPRVAAATPGHHSGHAPPSGVMPPGHPLTARPAEARKPTRDTEATPLRHGHPRVTPTWTSGHAPAPLPGGAPVATRMAPNEPVAEREREKGYDRASGN